MNEIKVGDILAGREKKKSWDEAIYFQVLDLNKNKARLKALHTGDISSISVDFCTNECWKLIKRQHTLCDECDYFG